MHNVCDASQTCLFNSCALRLLIYNIKKIAPERVSYSMTIDVLSLSELATQLELMGTLRLELDPQTIDTAVLTLYIALAPSL